METTETAPGTRPKGLGARLLGKIGGGSGMAGGVLDLKADAGYSAAWTKLQELRGQRDELDRAIGDVNARITAARNSLTDRASQLLAGEDASEADHSGLRDSLAGLRDRLNVVRRAIEIQESTVTEERLRASREICDRLRPAHHTLVAKIAAHLAALGHALVAEEEFADRLREGDVAFSGLLRRMNIPALGDPRERYSRIAAWLREAVDYGFIAENEIPVEWRERWSK